MAVTSGELSTPALLPQTPPSRNLPSRLRVAMRKEEKGFSKSEAERLDVPSSEQQLVDCVTVDSDCNRKSYGVQIAIDNADHVPPAPSSRGYRPVRVKFWLQLGRHT